MSNQLLRLLFKHVTPFLSLLFLSAVSRLASPRCSLHNPLSLSSEAANQEQSKPPTPALAALPGSYTRSSASSRSTS
ncbi:hypothetical protein B0T26DRAFT_733140 [Lasiosphaeria miniovina]|uniref:Secreted protein n=1 Tax=Lasiosphaeria miniovina TaxID=1954250 RepID=A0AA39ZUH9_9PEZI|nr:uncharacterized protein B0T26DRAFT_733140 [Lasiosphaeria miniovina]KAK0703888.1 hypothetical protein B0T26DRAFT_733140 [Lasiosphaeria miniovina]